MRRTLKIALLSLLPAIAQAQPPAGIDRMTITAVSPDPAALSGETAYMVEVEGFDRRGTRTFYIPYETKGQVKPQVGQACQIQWMWHEGPMTTGYGKSVSEGRWVTDFSCRAAPKPRG